MVQEFLLQIIGGVVIALLVAICWFIYGLPAILKELNEHMKTSEIRHEAAEMRLDIQDMLWSQEFQQSVSSKMLAKQLMNGAELPRRKKKENIP